MKQTWVLIEALRTKKVKVNIYFKFMTAIGPCATRNLDEAAKFESKSEAMASPAYFHSLTFFEPKKV